MPLENSFQSKLIKDLERLLPGCIVLKNDPNYLQGFPDLLILYGPRWAILETKRIRRASRRPNQEYYINWANDSFAYGSFISPENKEQVLSELQKAFRS